MASHYIDVFSFQFWRSPPPVRVQFQSESFSRVGVDGVGKVRTGKRGNQFQAILIEDMASYLYAMDVATLYHLISNTGPIRVIYNNIDYQQRYGHLYLVDHVEVMDCKRHPRLTGPGYDFIGGARITVRWTLTPHYIEPEPEPSA